MHTSRTDGDRVSAATWMDNPQDNRPLAPISGWLYLHCILGNWIRFDWCLRIDCMSSYTKQHLFLDNNGKESPLASKPLVI